MESSSLSAQALQGLQVRLSIWIHLQKINHPLPLWKLRLRAGNSALLPRSLEKSGSRHLRISSKIITRTLDSKQMGVKLGNIGHWSMSLQTMTAVYYIKVYTNPNTRAVLLISLVTCFEEPWTHAVWISQILEWGNLSWRRPRKLQQKKKSSWKWLFSIREILAAFKGKPRF